MQVVEVAKSTRLDAFALSAFECLSSRRQAQGIVKSGGIVVNGAAARGPTCWVDAGDLVSLLAPPTSDVDGDQTQYQRSVVGAENEGTRLQRFLAAAFAGVVSSRRAAHRAAKLGEVTVNGEVALADSLLVHAGDVVELRHRRDLARAQRDARGSGSGIEVCFEDEQCCVVWKPGGIDTNGSGQSERGGTLEQALRYEYGLVRRSAAPRAFNDGPRVCHRLDKVKCVSRASTSANRW